jgi:benzylsuccinate CoA-transferase BbsF subunit
MATRIGIGKVAFPCARVAWPSDLFDDPQLQHRQHFVERDHPSMVKFAYDMPAFRFASRAIRVERSPMIGEHSGYVLMDLLGFSEDEVSDLYAAEVVN